MDRHTVKAGNQIFMGKPAVPMPACRSEAISKLVASQPGVFEAHLPQCFIPGQMPKATQILFVVFQNQIVREAMQKIGEGLSTIFPQGEFLDMTAITLGDPLLEAVRGAGCQISSALIEKTSWLPWRRAV